MSLKEFRCWTAAENALYQKMAKAWAEKEYGADLDDRRWEDAYLTVAGRMRQLATGERRPSLEGDRLALAVKNRHR